MLVRILVIGDSESLTRRVVDLIKSGSVILKEKVAQRQTLDTIRLENYDLVIAGQGAFSESLVQTALALRRIPDGPELIALQMTEDPERRAALLAGGCLGVLYTGLSDEMLEPPLRTLIARRRDTLVQRLGLAQTQDSNRMLDFESASPIMSRTLAMARRVAAADSSLMIVGETGVGKEWFARAVHAEGPRAKAPFIAVNCAAVPESLLESELFGHERGAFTGASKARRGYFELAHKGTIFLDEITEMSPHLQAKLLRVLQERQVQRIGAEQPLNVDLRIMAATNRSPEEAIKAKTFRNDLFYRLSVVSLQIPPLRERPEDIPLLANKYLERFRHQMGRPSLSLSEAALGALVQYPWPGNVRELINVMERAVLLAHGTVISLEDLPESIGQQSLASSAPLATSALELPLVSAARTNAAPLHRGLHSFFIESRPEWNLMTLKEVRDAALLQIERAYLDNVLRDTNGSIRRTAEISGLDPRSIYNKMRQYEMRKEDYKKVVVQGS